MEDLMLIYRNNKERIIIGSRRTIKMIKNGKVEKVYLAKNAPEDIVKDIEYYSKIGGFEVIKLDITNEELGAMFKKPFKISVVSIIK